MVLRLLPLITGLLPILAIHISLMLAIDAGSIPACIPYIDGCASISATGRNEPASFIFKPAMMSEWLLLVFYWLFNVAWLRSLAIKAGTSTYKGIWISLIGCGGAIALILYVTFLGTHGAFYEFMRRFGVYFYFLFTVIAQIMLARYTIHLARSLNLNSVLKIGKIQMALALIPFILGALNLVLKSTLDNPDPAENIIEWVFALLMQSYFVLTYFSWRDTGFGLRAQVSLE